MKITRMTRQKRNPIAKLLRTMRYHKRVVRSRKMYSRKLKHAGGKHEDCKHQM